MKRMFEDVSETWNPVTGCLHSCAYCWARRLASRLSKALDKYKDGFEPRIHDREFSRGFEGGLVFVCDMGDLFGSWVPREWIVRVLVHIGKYPDTSFLLLTKNPSRYREFLDIMPRNAVLGATIETNRDDLATKYSNAPPPSERYMAMRGLEWGAKVVSVEPIMDFDLEVFVGWIREIRPRTVYVGYDNYNSMLPEPPLVKTLQLVERVSGFARVVRKTMRPPWWKL